MAQENALLKAKEEFQQIEETQRLAASESCIPYSFDSCIEDYANNRRV